MEGAKHVPPSLQVEQHQPPQSAPLRKIMMVAAIAAGIMFGWALQLSLLTPYVQLLGIPHTWASFIWLCGPISGMVVQPIVGYYSDNSMSRFGRRRPFIVVGAAFVALAVFLIGFAADIGHASGDPLGKSPKPRAIAVFVIGFWILDVSNNMIQGPTRAFLADLSGADDSRTRTANAMFAFFMAVGNVLGYAAGSYSHLHKMFPFTRTKACDVYCANLKSCFFLCIALMLTIVTLVSVLVKEDVTKKPKPESEIPGDGKAKVAFFLGEIFGAMKDLPRPMWLLLLVTFLNIFAWFPFMLFDTDWMGREVYGGKVGDGDLYGRGVRTGALGLMIQSIVLGLVSLGIEMLSRGFGGVKKLWGSANFFLAVCLALTVLITKLAESTRRFTTTSDGKTVALPPVPGVKAGALALFGVMGIPQAVTYSIPFALASIYSSKTGAGQGLTIGVLNLSIVVPQLIISVVGGPWDALFGGGNLPGFVVGAIAAAASGILALTLLPSPPPDVPSAKTATAGGFH